MFTRDSLRAEILWQGVNSAQGFLLALVLAVLIPPFQFCLFACGVRAFRGTIVLPFRFLGPEEIRRVAQRVSAAEHERVVDLQPINCSFKWADSGNLLKRIVR